MAKSYNQKVKILYLEKMLRGSGEDRVVTMQEILTKLSEYGIQAERKSIYDDIEALRSFGMDVKFRRGRPGGYYLAGQTVGKAAAEETVSRQAETAEIGTVEPDKVQPGDTQERPAAEENTGDSVRPGGVPECAEPERDIPRQTRRKEKAQIPGEEWSFEKASGSGKQMKLLCDNAVRKNVEAYLGKKAQYKEKELGYFTVTAGITEGPKFYGWLTSMGSKVHILKPKKTAQGYREYLKSLAKEYKGV